MIALTIYKITIIYIYIYHFHLCVLPFSLPVRFSLIQRPFQDMCLGTGSVRLMLVLRIGGMAMDLVKDRWLGFKIP